jgi:formylglycine-generating enzyme required for sulfatase activity
MRRALAFFFLAACEQTGDSSAITVGDDVDINVMKSIPAGDFTMGCNAAIDTHCGADESPAHHVRVHPFTLDLVVVTQGAYQKCIDAGKCNHPEPADPAFDPVGRQRYPVTNVAWEDARDYCAWAGKRLPTEAEWEWAARSGDGRLYPWGNDVPDCARANFGNCIGPNGGTEPVARHPTNVGPFGNLEMAGNVWEWVEDVYDAKYYAVSPVDDPEGPQGASPDATHAKRGGAWGTAPEALRTSQRLTHGIPHQGDGFIGFRCAK